MAIDYKIKKSLLPSSHYHYSSSGYVDLADVAEAHDSNLPSLDLTSYYDEMKFASKTSMNNSWIKTVGEQFKYGTAQTAPTFILKGTMPLFKLFHSITTPIDISDTPTTLTWNRTQGIKIGDTNYPASSFRGGVVPNAIIVELQGGGGGGGGTIYGVVQWTNGSGGGGGAHAVAVLDLSASSGTWKIWVGGGGAGAAGGASAHTGSGGGTTMITGDGGTVRAFGGYGGAANNFQVDNISGKGGTASASGSYVHSLLLTDGAVGGFTDTNDGKGGGISEATAHAFSNSSYNYKNINNKVFTAKSGGSKKGTAGGGGASRSANGANAKSGNGNNGSSGSGGSGAEQLGLSSNSGGNGGAGFIYFYY